MNGTTKAPKPSLRKRVVFWLITIAVPILLLEVFLRVYFAFQVGPGVLLYGFKSSQQQQVFDPTGFNKVQEGEKNHTVDNIPNLLENPTMSYTKYAPHQKTIDHNDKGEVFDVYINSRGFRGKNFNIEKKPGTLRVVTLGASSTFGYHDKDNETYPFYLDDTLSRRLKEHPCKQFTSAEVINFGIPHFTTDNIYALFVAEGLALNPDVVTFYEGVNDAHQAKKLGSTIGKAKSVLKGMSFIRDTYNGLRGMSILVAMVANINATMAMRFSAPEIELHAQGKGDHFVENVAHVYEECKKRGIVFVVANQQAKSDIVERENIKGVTYQQEIEMLREKLADQGKVGMHERDLLTHETIMKSLQSWATLNGVPFGNVIEALNNDRDVLLTWVHLTPHGNTVVASVFADKIMENVCPR